ncbi:MAG: hypothetical protein ABI601_18635 [bacterium]
MKRISDAALLRRCRGKLRADQRLRSFSPGSEDFARLGRYVLVARASGAVVEAHVQLIALARSLGLNVRSREKVKISLVSRRDARCDDLRETGAATAQELVGQLKAGLVAPAQAWRTLLGLVDHHGWGAACVESYVVALARIAARIE